MKLNINLAAKLCIYLQAISLASAGAPAGQLDRNDPIYRAQLEEECGDLGVMEVEEGHLESEVRHCLNHPTRGPPNFDAIAASLGEERVVDAAVPRGMRGRSSVNDPTNIFSRDSLTCWYNSEQFGCSDNSCWRICGSTGNWCWIAEGDGSGPWIKCSIAAQCDWNIGSCSKGSCGACGCGGC